MIAMTPRVLRNTLAFWMLFSAFQGFMIGASVCELGHLLGWLH
jgi:hypothetical protein